MLTIHGEKATNKIKWTEPKVKLSDCGRRVVFVIAVAYIGDDSSLTLEHFSSQYGTDREGRLVLPGFVSQNDKYNTFMYYIPVSLPSRKFPEDPTPEERCRSYLAQMGQRSLTGAHVFVTPARYTFVNQLAATLCTENSNEK